MELGLFLRRPAETRNADYLFAGAIQAERPVPGRQEKYQVDEDASDLIDDTAMARYDQQRGRLCVEVERITREIRLDVLADFYWEPYEQAQDDCKHHRHANGHPEFHGPVVVQDRKVGSLAPKRCKSDENRGRQNQNQESQKHYTRYSRHP